MKQSFIIPLLAVLAAASFSVSVLLHFNPFKIFSKGAKEMLVKPFHVIFFISLVSFYILYEIRETKRRRRPVSTAESITPTEDDPGQSKQFFFSPLGAKDEGVQGLFGSDSDLKENEPDAVERLLTSARS